jgi:hypothetical protein
MHISMRAPYTGVQHPLSGLRQQNGPVSTPVFQSYVKQHAVAAGEQHMVDLRPSLGDVAVHFTSCRHVKTAQIDEFQSVHDCPGKQHC